MVKYMEQPKRYCFKYSYPKQSRTKEDDIEWLLDHFRDPRIFGPDKWRIFERFIGYQVQYPGRKCKWAIVVASKTEEFGKGLLARMSLALGSYNVNENANYKHLINNHNTLNRSKCSDKRIIFGISK